MSAWRSGLWVFLAFVAVGGDEARAERILVRGRRGPIVINRTGGFVPNRGVSQVRRLSDNLFSINGRLFERNRFGELRPLFINRFTGQLLNATEPDTARQLAGLYARNLNRFSGPARALVDAFLRGQGIDPNRIAGGGFPGAPEDPAVCGRGGCAGGQPPGQHGNGSGGPTNPFGSQGRAPAAVVPVGADGGLTAEACRDIGTAICGNRDPRSDEQIVRGQTNDLFRAFQASTGISQGAFRQAIASVANSNNPVVERAYQGFFRFLKSQLPSLTGIINSVKANLAKSIDNVGLPPEMKTKLNSLTYVVAEPPTDASGRLDRRKLGGWMEGCGPDGLSPGAFAVPEANDVVVCPGMLLRAVALGGTAGLEEQLMHILGHESTHHFGADVDFDRNGRKTGESRFRPQFKKLLDCFQERFSGINAEKMGGEIGADFLGIKSQLERLKGATPGEIFKTFRSSMGVLCGSPNDGVHPSGLFRIGKILGEDPDFRALVKCPPSDEFCALSGRRRNL